MISTTLAVLFGLLLFAVDEDSRLHRRLAFTYRNRYGWRAYDRICRRNWPGFSMFLQLDGKR